MGSSVYFRGNAWLLPHGGMNATEHTAKIKALIINTLDTSDMSKHA